MDESSVVASLDLVKKLSGSPLSEERLSEVLCAYQPILAEIAKLRTLELKDIHPAVLFEPTACYRKA